jgi:hypothetical protein
VSPRSTTKNARRDEQAEDRDAEQAAEDGGAGMTMTIDSTLAKMGQSMRDERGPWAPGDGERGMRAVRHPEVCRRSGLQ